jgi:hypothetical protein
MLGVVAIFVPVVGVVDAIRLAKPTSPWARWRYQGRREHRLAGASERHARHRRGQARGDRLRDAIGGAPSAR